MIRTALFKAQNAAQSSKQMLSSDNYSEDYEKVWEIFKQVIKTGDSFTYNPNTPKQSLRAIWFAPNMHTYVYQNNNGEMLGSYLIKANQADLGSHVANASFMVHPKHQGKGIGKQLCQHCLKTAKQLGFKSMQFNIVVSTNLSAVSLWKKFGFQIVGTIPQAFNNLKLGKLVDAYVMYRKL